MTADVIVVGAGAAGILASWSAARLGKRIVLVEKTNRIGTKILVSGGGKCNITQDGEIEDLLRAFRPSEARFLRPAFYRFRNTDILELLTSRGLEVYTRPDGRVFPVNQTAKDVVAILGRLLEEVEVNLVRERPVSSLIVEGGRVVGIRHRRSVSRAAQSEAAHAAYRPRTAKNLLRELDEVSVLNQSEEVEIRAEQTILCTGGSSYPNSGTTGDGWPWLRTLGHTVCPVRAALAPMYLDRAPDWAGISLRDVVLKARRGKEIARWRGDMLFTHQGVSGPAALGISRDVAELAAGQPAILEVDLFPDLTVEELGQAVLSFAAAHPRARVSAFAERIPDRLLPLVFSAAEVAIELPGARLERKARHRLVQVLKGWNLGQVRHVPLEKGEVVAGGVSLDEVDPQTMRSRKVKGLLLCGEVLDIAGPVGGYNLQAAFSTGFVAGESAAGSPAD